MTMGPAARHFKDLKRFVAPGGSRVSGLLPSLWPTAFSRTLVAAISLGSGIFIPQLALRAEEAVTGMPVSKGLVAVGRMPASLRDAFGETFGSGSGMALDPGSWRKEGDRYLGALTLLPDRGYNVEGTTDYRARLNRIDLTLTPASATATPGPARQQAGLEAVLAGTTLLTDDKGQNLTGLDPESGVRPANGQMPALPQARTGKIALDAEALVQLADGSMLIADEYGPYVYHVGKDGKLISATQPPEALLPMRKGQLNFSSNNVGEGGIKPDPKDPETGRQNNQGLEGMSLTPDGRFLIAVLQSATRQDGGDSSATRMHTRALVYDAADVDHLKLVHEFVVPLPTFEAKGKTAVAAQSEILALSDRRFLMLARDSNSGQGMKSDTSVYRKITLVDLAGATDIANSDFDGLKPVAPKGVLEPGITAARVTPFIDINDGEQLGRFGLHNGAPNDRNNLSEKWEAMTVASVLEPSSPDDYFLFVANDNDFLTQDGFQVGAAYKAEGGAEVDTMILVYRVTLPDLRKK